MIRTRALLTGLLTLALLGLGACKSAHDSTGASAQAAAAKPDGRPKTDLASSIATAQKSAPDARFLGAEFESEGGKEIYSIVFVGQGVVHEINIDSADGKILASEQETLDEENQKLIDGMMKEPAAIGIDKAIAAALAKLPGSWARAAGLASSEGHTCYGVLVMDAGAAKHVLVSAQDGTVQQVRAAEEEEEGEEGMEESEETESAAAKPK